LAILRKSFKVLRVHGDVSVRWVVANEPANNILNTGPLNPEFLHLTAADFSLKFDHFNLAGKTREEDGKLTDLSRAIKNAK
jgi:hypothetical protein